MADDTRRRVVYLLRAKEMTVGQIHHELQLTPQAIYHHIRKLLDAGEDVTIIDLRTPLDVQGSPYAIPGSRWLPVEAIDEHEAEFLRARDLVLYCA